MHVLNTLRGGLMTSTPIDIREARMHLSRLMNQAAAGQDVILARKGKPVARLSRLAPPARKIRFGVLKGRVRVAEDFDAPRPDAVDAAFEGA
jgi:antitoxin (DNA-binding transcriptional repressor) of toxin-antitoxin stability system